jgi:hypothetical protein
MDTNSTRAPEVQYSPLKTIDGCELSRALKKAGVTARSVMASELETGAVALLGMTRQQAVALTGVSSRNVGLVNRASLEDRRALERGSISISNLRRRRRPVSDSDIARYVRRVGPDRILNVVNQLTAPVLTAAE